MSTKSSAWDKILKVIIAVASGTFGCIQRTRHEQRWSPLKEQPPKANIKEKNEKN